eukprot:TRINITY_DN5804_c0_g1_i1.p1 TRINITY_DN5804_c0_g1~~TRINITY_DN5804_c0_g1_i1.p1  ORF type:complete len:251 (-),score=50.36 TRINITY_DN5804_c0_g1_i1:513-1265(-)
MPVKQEVSQAFTGHWKVGLFQAPCYSPHCCVFGCCCICCAACKQRTELLDLTGEPYVCCAGLFPCGPLGDPQDRMCLGLEVCCCPGLALNANRWMVQTRFDRENTFCDDCLICFTCLCSWGVMIARCFVDVPEELEMAADCLVMSVQGCMHAQQQIEIEEVKKTGYQGMNANILGHMPPKQQQMMAAFGGPVHGGGMGHGGPAPQQYPPQQQMGGGGAIQVQCGSCGNVFGAPQTGVIVACPHCGAQNNV